MNLDGETNLKPKVIAHEMINNDKIIPSISGSVQCDSPNSSLEEWDGLIKFSHPDVPGTHALKIKNLLLRGCFLRNTACCYGLVIYMGIKTKIMMNAKKPPRKVSQIMRMMNYMLYTVFMFQFLIILLYATLSTIWLKNKGEKYEYLNLSSSGNAFTVWIVQLFTYWVAYSHMIPISLYVIIEV